MDIGYAYWYDLYVKITTASPLADVDVSYQYIVKGAIFIVAVAFDVKTRGGRK